MSGFKKIPSAEFEIMKIIWNNPVPTSCSQIMLQFSDERKPQTILTLLTRLTERAFLSKSKNGKELLYTPLITQEEYLKFETKNFFKIFHSNSMSNMLNALYDGNKLSPSEIEQIESWIKDKK